MAELKLSLPSWWNNGEQTYIVDTHDGAVSLTADDALHAANISLTPDEARELARALTSAAEEL
jgi:hypothetical protein